MSLAAKLRRAPGRIATGAFILNAGLTKLRADEQTAKNLHDMAAGAYPVLAKVPPKPFLKALAVAETSLGSALLLPIVPARLAGAGLMGFSGGLLTMWWRTPGMHDGLRPTRQGTVIAKDVWLFGIGSGLVIDSVVGDAGDSHAVRKANRKTARAERKAEAIERKAELKANVRSAKKAGRKAARRAARASELTALGADLREHAAEFTADARTAARHRAESAGEAAKEQAEATRRAARKQAKSARRKAKATASKQAKAAGRAAEPARAAVTRAAEAARGAGESAVSGVRSSADTAAAGVRSSVDSAAASTHKLADRVADRVAESVGG